MERLRRLSTIACGLLAAACSLTSAQTARPLEASSASQPLSSLRDGASPSATPSLWQSLTSGPRASSSAPLSPPAVAAQRLAQASTPLQEASPSPTGKGPASPAQPWVRIAAPGADELWYDREKLVFSGNEVTYWRRVNFALPQQFKGFQVRTALYREQINCNEHTLRVHAQVFQAIDGAVVEQVNYSAPETVFIVPDTIGDALEHALCPTVAQYRMANERLQAAQERLDNRRKELDRLRGDVEDLEASVARLRSEARNPTSDAARDAVRDTTRDAPRQPGRQGS